MISQQNQANQNPEQTSVVLSGVELNSRLRDIRDRIDRIYDAVHGPGLKGISDSTAKAEAPPTNSIRRNLTVGFVVINEIDALLNRLESNLT